MLAISIAIALVFWGVPAWIASKAKPLGDKPYRWGMFIGIVTCIIGTVLVLSPYTISKRSAFAVIFFIVFGLPMILGGVGLIRRKKWGVVVFFLAWFMLMCMNSVFDSIRETHTANPTMIGSSLVIMAVSALYFGKRWRNMGK